jgi:uncharacterized protein with HEPN domain
MPEKSFVFYFEDILESIEKIHRYLGEASFDEFLENEMLIDAVIRNLEIIGEAAAHMILKFPLNIPKSNGKDCRPKKYFDPRLLWN